MTDGGRLSRQTFLGSESERVFERVVVGVAGLGGGGSHIVQQLAHIGLRNYVIFDADRVEDSNLNRLVGGTGADAAAGTLKVDVAERTINGLWREARVQKHACRWQDRPDALRACDLVFGCVDGFQGRLELEQSARRYLIPLIDIGMDVHPPIGGEPPRMAGQVILSRPGGPCMRCLGFLTDELLTREAQRYGAAGSRPQVVWPNGILASTAVGIAVDLLTDWTRSLRQPIYMSYDGNSGTLRPHPMLARHSGAPCPHYPASEVGDVRYRPL